MLFLAIFGLPNVGKCSFCCFSVFPMLGNAVFAVFWFSQCWETLFLAFSVFPNIGKTVFISRHRGLILDEWANETCITTIIITIFNTGKPNSVVV